MRWIFLLAWCVACTGPQPAATDRLDCYGCHQAEYETAPMTISACTKKPVHDPALGYTTNCYTCHGTVAPGPSPDPAITLSGWCPAVDPVTDPSNHSKFRIATGSHTGFDCADCHTSILSGASLPDATAPMPIGCTSCHWHDKAQTDAHHLGKSGYSYGPATCLAANCHGGGRRQ